MKGRMLYQCPFFKRGEYLRLDCEGGVLSFPDKEARVEYVMSFCANPINWKKCSIAHCLENYYDRKDER